MDRTARLQEVDSDSRDHPASGPATVDTECGRGAQAEDAQEAQESPTGFLSRAALADEQSGRSFPGEVTELATRSLPHWTVALAERIGLVYSEAEASFTQWSFEMALDPEVLPLSTLRLSCSQCRLSLRFTTLSPMAQQLIFNHGPSLVLQLQRCALLPGNIDIEFT